MKAKQILMLEDDRSGERTAGVLRKKGHSVHLVRRGSDAIRAYEQDPSRWSGVALDLYLAVHDGIEPDEFCGNTTGGLEVLRRLRAGGFRGPAVIFSQHARLCTDEVRRELRIAEVISKDLTAASQVLAVELFRALFPPEWQKRKELLGQDVVLEELPDLQGILAQIRKCAYFDRNMLLVGEPGVGKEALCRYYFVHSGRTGGFVPIPGAQMIGDAMRVALCGQAPGFPGPGQPGKDGAFERAGHGSVYIGELDKYCENAGTDLGVLYHVTEERYLTRLGSIDQIEVNATILASANDLGSMSDAIKDRFDIVRIPPLRQRHRDARVLARHHRQHFLETYNVRPDWEITEERLEELIQSGLPRNIRTIKRWAIDGKLQDDVPPEALTPPPARVSIGDALDLSVRLADMETYSELFGNEGRLKAEYWKWLAARWPSRKGLIRASGATPEQIDAAVRNFDLKLRE